MNEQSTIPKPKPKPRKKKEIKSPALIAREKLQQAQIENNKAMWKELLAKEFDVTKCLHCFEIASQLQQLRDYIALNKCPPDLK